MHTVNMQAQSSFYIILFVNTMIIIQYNKATVVKEGKTQPKRNNYIACKTWLQAFTAQSANKLIIS